MITVSRARVSTILCALGLASAGCYLMCATQLLLTREIRFTFLYWNLILAWIPVFFAVLARRLLHSPVPRGGAFAACAVAWFLFFPNAPYIVTDFVHLPMTHWRALWYLDLLIILSFAWTGLSLGYVSLFLMQEVVRDRLGAAASWGFAVGVLGISSFGIYLGRFSRFNSWDVLRHPARLAVDSVRLINPFANPSTLAFSGALFLFLLISYSALFALTNLHARPLES